MTFIPFAAALVCVLLLACQTGEINASPWFGKKVEKNALVEEKSDKIQNEKKGEFASLFEKLKSLEERVLDAKSSLETDKEKAAEELEEVDIMKTLKEKKKPNKEKAAVDKIGKGKVDKEKDDDSDDKDDDSDDKDDDSDDKDDDSDDKDDDSDDKENDKDGNAKDDSDDDDNWRSHGMKKEEGAVKKISSAAAKMSSMKKLIQAAKQKKEKAKAMKTPGKHYDSDEDSDEDNNDDADALEEWLIIKLAIAEMAMEQFEDLMSTLDELFSFDDLYKKAKKTSQKDSQSDYEEWVAEKLELAEKAMEQFEELMSTLAVLFSLDDDTFNWDDDNEIGYKKDAAKIKLVEEETYGKLSAMKEKLTGKLNEVSGSVSYLDKMINSFGKLFAKKK